jgi:TonB family protein
MGDYVIATDPATAWTHVKSLMAQMKYKTVRLDEEHQYLVTEETNYARTLPDLKQLGIVKDGRPTRVKWYVSVPRDFAAARLSIASEVQVVNGREVYTVYRTPPLAEWFRDQLSRHMTLSIEPLSSDVQERTNRSSPISEPDHRSCSPPASPIMVRDTPVPNLRMPQVLQEYKPFFPQGEMRQQHEGSVLLQGVVMEHGSVTSIKILRSPDDSPGLVTNAIAAAAMWRFLPARVDGCPVPMTITIELSFKLR